MSTAQEPHEAMQPESSMPKSPGDKKFAKRKVAILLGYNGTNYQGVQM